MIRFMTAFAALILLVTAAPAYADEPEWNSPAPCATGELTGTWVAPDEFNSGLALWVSGWIQPCKTVAKDSEYGFVYYTDTGAGLVHLNRLRKYASDGPTTLFTRWLLPPDDEIYGHVTAFCLARNYQARVACISLGPQAGSRFALQPIPVNDPRVSGKVTDVTNAEGLPNCATCA